jgi:hypothetical protein
LKLPRFKKLEATGSLSYLEYRPNEDTSKVIYIQNIYPKVGLLEKTKGRGKDGKKDSERNEICHICIGTRHKETH